MPKALGWFIQGIEQERHANPAIFSAQVNKSRVSSNGFFTKNLLRISNANQQQSFVP
jgi:hypothetical protein